MKNIFNVIMVIFAVASYCTPKEAGAQFRKILVSVPDTIRDGKWFDATVLVVPPTGKSDSVRLKAIPAYVEDSLLMDSLNLFPWIVQLNATGDTWAGTVFFKNKKKRPEDEWIKIEASYYGIPPAVDSSRTIFARYGPFASSDGRDQIRIIPNPIGAPGLPAEITIWRRGVVRKAEVKIFDSYGHLVRDLTKDVMEGVNERLPRKKPVLVDSLDMTTEYSTLYTTWNGKNDRGRRVANGVYQLCVKTIQAEEAAIWKEKIGVIW